MKRAFTIATLLTLSLILAGCFEDKEANLASCLLNYEKNGTDVQNIMLCMSTKGYKFADSTDVPNKIAAKIAA